MVRKRVLIDCDPGIDDALALLFALASNELKIEAITTVYGNVSVHLCTENLKNILTLCRLKTFPKVGIGSSKPLKRKRPRRRAVHGKDGLGNTFLNLKSHIEVSDAIELTITKILNRQIDYIIATGPLTNIAKVIIKKPCVQNLVKGIFIMGGTIFSKGNISPYAEFNIYNDPDAAKIVFDSNIPKVLVGLDVTRKVVLTSEDLAKLCSTKNSLSNFIFDIANFSIEYHRNFRNVEGAYMNDPLCVAVAINRKICRYKKGYIDVVLGGPHKGKIYLSSDNKKGASETLFCIDVNVPQFKKMFLGSINKLMEVWN